MDDEKLNGVSRRRMLKRIGAGAAIVWSAPVLTSLRVPAFAQGVSPSCACTSCDDFACGASGPFDSCFCTTAAEGGCFCREIHSVTFFPETCTDDTPCPPGWRCVCTGLGNVCRPPCGANVPEGTAGESDLA